MKQQYKSGFFIIELLIVIALVAIIFSLTTASVQFVYRYLSSAQLKQLYHVCHFLQQRAIATHRIQELFIDIRRHSYRYDETEHLLSPGLEFGFIPGVKGPPATPTVLIAQPVTFKDSKIVFHPDGIISSGSIYLYDKKGNALYALTNAVATISFLRLYRYDTSWSLMM